MSDSSLILGIDIGTSSVKVALITRQNDPQILVMQSRDFGASTKLSCSSMSSIFQPNEHEQDVGKIFYCLHFLLSRLPQSQMVNVTAISVAGQMHGVLGWSCHDLAFVAQSKINKQRLETATGGCGNLITWLDSRCNKTFIDNLPKTTCSEKPASGFGCATLLWELQYHPGEFSPVPVDEINLRQQFQKAAVLRKISVGSRVQRFGRIGLDTNSAIPKSKSLSTSQMVSPHYHLATPIEHPPWTCTGTIADFLVVGLASLSRAKMSPQMAMSWGYFDVERNCWDMQALDASGYTLSHLLPEIVPCGTIVGKLSFNWEGIPAGAEVFVAHGDLQCSVYPFLEQRRRPQSDKAISVAACNLSTSAQIAFKLPNDGDVHQIGAVPEADENAFTRLLRTNRLAIWPFFEPGERIVVGASLNGGNVIDRFVKMLRVWCRQLGCPAMEHSQIYARLMPPTPSEDHFLNQFASLQKTTASDSASRLRVDPRLFGERYGDPLGDARSAGASLTNIQPGNMFNLPDVYAAICRGVVANLVEIVPPEVLVMAGVQRLICMGGALKRNPILLQQLEHEFARVDIECSSTANSTEACVGAALYAATKLIC